MKKILFILLTSFISLQLNANTFYVNLNATGNNNGTTWTDAYIDLQDAIAASNFGDDIWVASGIYKPTTTTNRTVYFSIKNGTKVYGGFNATEVLLTERNPDINQTILSGEISSGSLTDNTYHVVYFNNVGNQTILDGFDITSGYTTGNSTGGGAIYSLASSPSIINCNVYGNHGSRGGALRQITSGIITITDCKFDGNIAFEAGGAIYLAAGTGNFTNCEFVSNQAVTGGAMYLSSAINNIDKCIISGNTSTNIASGIYLNTSALLNLSNSLLVGNYASNEYTIYCAPISNSHSHTVTNCTIADNFQGSSDNTATTIVLNSSTTFTNSIIYNNNAAFQVATYIGAVENCFIESGFTGSGGLNILSGDPLFINSGILSNAPFVHTGLDYRLSILSPAINYGNNAFVTNTFDLNDSIRTQNSIVDLGAYENYFCESTVNITANPSLTICNSNPITLNVLGAVNYVWSTSSNSDTITVSNPGTYTVIIEDTIGCRANLEANVLTGSNPSPEITNSVGTLTTGLYSSYQWYFNNNIIPTETSQTYNPGLNYGTYQVEVTSTLGCTGTVEYCYSPAQLNTNGPTIFCDGDTVILSITNGNSFLWSNSEIDSSIIVTNSGNYSVLVSNLNAGCTVEFEQNVLVNANPNPIVTYSSSILETQLFDAYQWYYNGTIIPGATFNSYIPNLGTGQYYVIVTNSNGCTNTSNAFNYFVGLNDLEAINFTIYPNPVQNVINFDKTIETIKIYTIQGKLIIDKTIMNDNVDISELISGSYLILLTSDEVTYSAKIVKL
jgi:hypothetical protein